jgi:predicted TIM-barrel fold metal-dependent hydrolase
MSEMSESGSSSARRVRERLGHPVIDADGHMIEHLPALERYFAEEGVAVDIRRIGAGATSGAAVWDELSAAQRAATRATKPPWWALPARNTRDYATALLPGLMYERLDEFGLDFSVIYPSMGLMLPHVANDDVRPGACRALNRYLADIFAGYGDRLAPVAVIPMHTPEEAVAELDHAVGVLGFKAVLLASYVYRPIAGARRLDDPSGEPAGWIDTYGIDSEHDYDPVWARCVELGVSVAMHSPSWGFGFRRSTSSYVYNHIGTFGASSEAVCKSLVLGGVTRRFPTLRFAMLEGGVAWASALLADLVGHWEKRNLDAVQLYDPSSLDQDLLTKMLAQYGSKVLAKVVGSPVGNYRSDVRSARVVDEYAACGIETLDDLVELFVPKFSFGCEADDPLVSLAYATSLHPLGSRLNALFSSDVGHWDVRNMADVLVEAYEGVEHGAITEADFRDFTLDAACRFYQATNPRFFDGTVLEPIVALSATAPTE